MRGQKSDGHGAPVAKRERPCDRDPRGLDRILSRIVADRSEGDRNALDQRSRTQTAAEAAALTLDRQMKHQDDFPLTVDTNTAVHHTPETFQDRVALRIVKTLRFVADRFFAGRYGHRAVVLETVAAVPGMVGGLLQHLKAIRHIRDDQGWIKELIDEADNERMHLMTFIHIAKPTRFERFVIMVTQLIFYNVYFFLYLLAPRTAHRMVGYLEEEAVVSYTQYLAQIDAGQVENVPAPQIAKDYWSLPDTARLREVVLVIRDDEARHRDTNHGFANAIDEGVDPHGAVTRKRQAAEEALSPNSGSVAQAETNSYFFSVKLPWRRRRKPWSLGSYS